MKPYTVARFPQWLAAAVCSKALPLMALIALLSAPAFADGFPGKGSASDWHEGLLHYDLANKYLNTDRTDQAVEEYTKAIQIYQYDPDFYCNLGIAYKKLDDLTDAEEAFKKASELDPKDWMPLMDLASGVYVKQNKLQEALDTFQRALKCNPPNDQKAGIQQDIADIRKFMKMQGIQGDKQLTVNPAPSIQSNQPSATVRDDDPLQPAPTPPHAKSVRTPAASSAPAKIQPSSASENKALKDSGWDYVNK